MAIDTVNARLEAAQRLIKAATGDEHGDGSVVTDFGVGIVEPGYGDEDTVWVTGNWNPSRFPNRNDPADKLTNDESRPSRLGDALDRIGIEILWLDEWTTCSECQGAVRDQPDSYSWTPHYIEWPNNGERVCLDCLSKDENGDWLYDAEFVNDAQRCVPGQLANSKLEEWGWRKLEQEYQSGWYHRDDRPADVLAKLREEGHTSVLFRVFTQQFAVDFEAWVRDNDDDHFDQEEN